MTEVDKLVEEMAKGAYETQPLVGEPRTWVTCMPSVKAVYVEEARAMLRIVLQEIQNGGVVNVDMDYQVYLKPDFKKFLNKA